MLPDIRQDTKRSAHEWPQGAIAGMAMSVQCGRVKVTEQKSMLLNHRGEKYAEEIVRSGRACFASSGITRIPYKDYRFAGSHVSLEVVEVWDTTPALPPAS